VYLAVPVGLIRMRITLITVACRLGILGLDECAEIVEGIWARKFILALTPKSVLNRIDLCCDVILGHLHDVGVELAVGVSILSSYRLITPAAQSTCTRESA
jgi:hypothetical protein